MQFSTPSPPPSHATQRSKYVLFPIQFPQLWDAYKLAQSSFWTADELDLSTDIQQWRENLTQKERNLVSSILGFFAASDGIVVENLAQRFCAEVDIPEARCFYGYQIMIENVHAEVYSRFIQELIGDPREQQALFSATENRPAVKAKADWCVKWIQAEDVDFPTRLVAFAIVEGIFFSSSFATLYWLRHRNRMPALTYSNELIARDEGQHTAFACLLYSHMPNRPAVSVVNQMVRDAVDLEKAFFKEIIPSPLVGMNYRLMNDYVEYVADFLLFHLGHPNIFYKKNPFPYMERTAIDSKTNFFERSVSEYHGATVRRG